MIAKDSKKKLFFNSKISSTILAIAGRKKVMKLAFKEVLFRYIISFN